VAKGPENTFKNGELKRKLKEFKRMFFFTKEAVGIRGIPDIIGCCSGRFFALEVKAHRNAKRTRLQEWKISLIRKAGGFAEFIYPENCDEVLERLYNHCCLLSV